MIINYNNINKIYNIEKDKNYFNIAKTRLKN